MTDALSREIAVVDDDPAVLDSLRFILEIAGFPVATYLSASAFLATDVDCPRCVIIDQHMPMMTGLELIEILRARRRDMPIMLITAAPSPPIYARAASFGVPVVEKPASEDILLAFVACRQESTRL
jgi:two-component system response regulator FixJ